MTIEEIREYNEKTIKEIKEATKIRELQAQRAFEKRIDREWEKHVRRCVKKGTLITQDFTMKVKGDRLPFYMEEETYSYTSNNGTFSIGFEVGRLSWFRIVYYYTVHNMNSVWN